ncbi:MAG: amidohydrolase family protein, partial [Isosphaeraceae bacterium]
SPLWGFYGGFTRKAADGTPPAGWRPEQRLTMEELLTGFTTGSAYAQFAENRLGQLKAGYQADFVVFDQNLLKAKDADIMKTRVLATWIAGELTKP